MDVSFSAWRHSREASLQLKGDSFSFLFDRRYTNRLNRMSRVFFEAYVAATKELAAQEDRFPSLSEIDAKMESGAVYAFKDRLMKNTEFFEEVKISGVSYLVPRALKFVDVTGTYTDLILNFEEGTVVLPTRRKTPSFPDNQMSSVEEEEIKTPQVDETASKAPTIAEDTAKQEAEAKPQSYPLHTPEAFEEIPLATENEEAAAPPEPAKKIVGTATSPARKMDKPPLPDKKMAMTPKAVALGVAILLALAAAIFFLGPTLGPTPEPAPVRVEYSALVAYSAYLSNSSNESYLGLNITNPQGITNDMEMALPRDIDQSISARGGIVTISHGENTMVRMNSSGDASVKIYLQGNRTTIPVGLSFYAPEGFDTSLQIHGKDYNVTRKNETSVLMFNLTREGVSFEQSYTRKT
jgi:hypothetical protein